MDSAQKNSLSSEHLSSEGVSEDFTRVINPARIAVYDNLLSSPRIIDIQPDTTLEFIGKLAAAVYENAKHAGGTIPYTIILQVTENFIHARFTEVVVSILDSGNTIRFTDQGPGIADKQKAQQPGYSSATTPMKKYINGVGSGLPIVREYLETQNGNICIEDNMNSGAVITISLNGDMETSTEEGSLIGSGPKSSARTPESLEESKSKSLQFIISSLSARSIDIIKLFEFQDILGVTDISKELGLPPSSTHSELNKLEEAGIITKLARKRVLTDLGTKVAGAIYQ